MIPKIIHYCWFGKKPLPQLAKKCIDSWKIYLPDYEIKEWNESNFDVNAIPYTKQAYKAGKYAFVSDYARFWILYKYGGVYFDTDVEIIKPINDIIKEGPFMGCEPNNERNKTYNITCAPGLGLGCELGMPIYKEFIEGYKNRIFIDKDNNLDLTTIVVYTTNILIKHGLKNTNCIQKIEGISIYPSQYFCPINFFTGSINVTNETRTIHHYFGSWNSPQKQYEMQLRGKYVFLPNAIAFRLAFYISSIKYNGILQTIKTIYNIFRKRFIV